MLRAGLVGLGWWGRTLAEAARSTTDVLRFTSCFSPNAAEHAAFAREFDIREASSFDDMLRDPALDAVVLATPHTTHADLAVLGFSGGKHVFVEKPLALTINDAERIAAAARRAKRVLAVGHNRRFNPGVLRLKELVEAAALGAILHVEANYSIDSATRYAEGFWRADRREAPGGALPSLGLHMIDTMTVLFGRVARVSSLMRRVALAVDIDDATVALMVFESGLTASLTTLFATPLTSHMRISGSKAIADARDDFSRLEIIGERTNDAETFEPLDTVAAELCAFASACEAGTPVFIKPEEAVHDVAILEAMVISAADGGAWTTVAR